MGPFKLNLKLAMRFDKCAEIAQRMRDFSIPFGEIINEWAAGNVRKFGAGKGSESSGFSGGDLTPARWEPLTEEYRRAKERKGFANWLMVRTGALMDSLCNRGAFSEFMDSHRVIFGVPLDSQAADEALHNSESRPTIFLSGPDRLMIRRNLQQYISMGGTYKDFLWARAGKLGKMQDEAYEMDLNFAEAVNG